PRPAKASEGN
ncbi:hypothetical protein A2U01_0107240, partial [Trifolium medium]|nr:hypothetical protein [Trifolium medium]